MKHTKREKVLLEALEEVDVALTTCVKYFLGIGPQPDPGDMGTSVAVIKKAIAKAEGKK